MDKKQVEQLLRRYLDGRCSPKEQRLVELWYHELLDEEKQRDEIAIDEGRLKREVWKHTRKRRPAHLRRFVAAAAVLFVVATGIYFYKYKASRHLGEETTVQEIAAIQTSRNHIVLKLADGTLVDLDENQEGILIGPHITYLDGSSIESPVQLDLQRMTIATPRGGQYRVILPDGTEVWLNAATTLEFELQPDDSERIVTLNGEAYFDVSSRQSREGGKATFTVKTRRQEVTVLGTGFNVSAYEESPQTVTTLVHGAVRVSGIDPVHHSPVAEPLMLEPGFQAVTTAQHTEKLVANLESAMGWKNGDFVFDGSSIREIMQQLARWYDMDVAYRGTVPNEAFGGKIARSKKLSEVLRVLELTGGVTFTIEDRTIIVNPNE
ncbi:FecR family protein [Parapedobacter soli]|uniref:FecR family protein n=1 Tax=Parapedobacter soli TaxID=416955 RepID=UPI0021C90904|nr:FecR family protein [Parapedobacter soli]